MSECSCETCSSACRYRPGWFAPGEAERAAALKGMTLKEFFDAYLGVDFIGGDDGGRGETPTKVPTWVLAPAITSMTAGHVYPSDPRGRCVFLQDGACTIHAAKPHECREYLHDQKEPEVIERHQQVSLQWLDHQAQIAELLGAPPVLPPIPEYISPKKIPTQYEKYHRSDHRGP